MKHFLSCFALASAFTLPAIAHADTLRDFNLNGTIKSGIETGPRDLPLNGLLTLDITTGTFVNGKLGNTSPDTFSSEQESLFGYTRAGLGFGFLGPQGYVSFSEFIDLFLPVASLVNYQGGDICVATSPCGVDVSDFTFGPGDRVFTSGTLSATPEPSSLVLLGTGILGVIRAARRRFTQ